MVPLLFLVLAVSSAATSLIAGTTLSKLSSALNSRNLAQGFECLQSLQLIELGSDQFVSQLCRSSVSLTSSAIDTADFLMSVITLPPAFSMPLHSRPGIMLSKVMYGSVTLRDFEILQFVSEDDALKGTSFQHEDAFAGDEDCVCRGGKCPRRDGCIFWVNKQLRDSGSSLYVSEHGFSTLATGDSEVVAETAGPRELINTGSTSAVFIEILIKDLDQADMIEDIPNVQFYRADRLTGAGVKGNKLKVTASSEPLGLIPMYVPWRGARI